MLLSDFAQTSNTILSSSHKGEGVKFAIPYCLLFFG